MKITTDHPASSYGVPVILADDGALMDTGPGIRAVRDKLGLSRSQLGKALGVSPRTIQAYEQSARTIPTKLLYQLAEKLEPTKNTKNTKGKT